MLCRLFRPFIRVVRDDAGSPSVEFAFAALPLVLMVVGTMEFGMIMFTSTLMESGLRDAARFGITGQEPEAERTGQNEQRQWASSKGHIYHETVWIC